MVFILILSGTLGCMLVEKWWKYLKTAAGERLFDLSVDPGEKTDLRSKHAATFEEVF